MTDRNVYKLSLKSDPERSVRVATGESLSVGSDGSSQFQIVHRSVAASHCVLENKDGLLKLIPVGGAAIAVETRFLRGPAILKGGESIRIGAITLQLRKLGMEAPKAAERSTRVGSFKKRPRMLGITSSVVAHVVLVLMLGLIPFLTKRAEVETRISMSIDYRHEAPALEEPKPTEEKEPENPQEPTEAPQVFDEDPVENHSEIIYESPLGLSSSSAPNLIGIGSGSGPFSALSVSEKFEGGNGMGGALKGWAESGLDLAFVIDSTVSMKSALDNVKASMNQLVRLLAVIAPDIRVGIVAYTDESDPRPIQTLDFTDRRFALLNFIQDLRAEGGGDFEEALTPGIKFAVHRLSWRIKARRVIIIVGDAPARRDSLDELFGAVDSYVQTKGALKGPAALSTLFVVSDDRVTQRRRVEVAALFSDLAKRGGGVAIEMVEEELSTSELISLVFGLEYDNALLEMISTPLRSVRTDMVRRKISNKDSTWLISKIRKPHPHPLVVEGLIELADAAIIRELIEVIGDDKAPAEARFASIYVLKRTLRTVIRFDPRIPVRDQREAFGEIIKAAVARGFDPALDESSGKLGR